MTNSDKPNLHRNRSSKLEAIAHEILAIREADKDNADIWSVDNRNPSDDGACKRKSDFSFDNPLWLKLARQAYEDRRRRNKIFGSGELFGEPAWDILLDLFIAAKERRAVSVTSACIGSAVPSTTALRWISILESQGLLVRKPDESDGRRFHLSLSQRGYSAMVEYFSASSKAVIFLDNFQEGHDHAQSHSGFPASETGS